MCDQLLYASRVPVAAAWSPPCLLLPASFSFIPSSASLAPDPAGTPSTCRKEVQTS